MGDWPNRFKDLSDVTTSTAGPPTAGTWNVADVSIDVNGTIWVCTVAGTPGTWASATGRELQYAERTTSSAALGPTITDIPGLSITFTPPTSQAKLILDIGSMSKDATAGWVFLQLIDGGNVAEAGRWVLNVSASALLGAHTEAKLTGLTPGTPLTYKARVQCSAGAVTINGGSPSPRPFIEAVTV